MNSASSSSKRSASPPPEEKTKKLAKAELDVAPDDNDDDDDDDDDGGSETEPTSYCPGVLAYWVCSRPGALVRKGDFSFKVLNRLRRQSSVAAESAPAGYH